ncbi:MAG: protein kinase [Myxococcales bacterium]|nr:protein kinase [Myxococcales bacterium]
MAVETPAGWASDEAAGPSVQLPPDLSLDRILHRSAHTLVARCAGADGARVVVKTPAPWVPAPEAEARYRREHRLLTLAPGPHLVGAVELRFWGARPFLVLADAGAETLAHHLAWGPLRPDDVLHILVCAARALRRLHAVGVLHRDVCPANLLWAPRTGAVELIDLDRALERETPAAAPELAGPPTYRAPELCGIAHAPADARADLYALGVTAWQLLVGHPPFDGADAEAVIHAHLARRATPVHRVRAEVPRALSDIVQCLLRKRPADRYPDAAALLADLEAAQRGGAAPGARRVADVGRLHGRAPARGGRRVARRARRAGGGSPGGRPSGGGAQPRSRRRAGAGAPPDARVAAAADRRRSGRGPGARPPRAVLGALCARVAGAPAGAGDRRPALGRRRLARPAGPRRQRPAAPRPAGRRASRTRASSRCCRTAGRLSRDPPGALDEAALAGLIADTLACGRADAAPLAAVLERKTGGNPLFVNLFSRGCATTACSPGKASAGAGTCGPSRAPTWATTWRASSSGGWRRCRARRRRWWARPPASAGGPRGVLARVADCPPEVLMERIRPALAAGVLVVHHDVDGVHAVGFPHDRIVEAARARLTAEQRAAIHLRIGRCLAGRAKACRRAVRGRRPPGARAPAMGDAAERVRFAHLARRAGDHAWASAGFEDALGHYDAGIEALGPAGWGVEYDLALALHEGAAEAARVVGRADRMNACVDAVLAHAAGLADQAAAWSTRIVAATDAGGPTRPSRRRSVS